MKKDKNLLYYLLLLPLLVLLLWGIFYLGRRSADAPKAYGKKQYITNCGGCHGKRGEGLANLIPPLNDPKWLTFDKLVCIAKYGISDTIYVNKKMYYQPMPANLQLTTPQITAITNFIYAEFLNTKRRINLEATDSILNACFVF